MTYSVGTTQYVAVVVGLRNNHINDLSEDLQRVPQEQRRPSGPPLRGGAAIWVFAP